jgi:hypothetical protein
MYFMPVIIKVALVARVFSRVSNNAVDAWD